VRRLFVPRAAAGRTRRSSPDQWAHPIIELDQAQQARGFKDGSTITVAIVDSGIDASHPDLKPALTEYKNFLREKDKDFIGHGTHVAGIVGARAATATGVAGVSRARLLALKALPRDDDDFDAPAYYRALRYVIGRAQVLNLSLGGAKDLAEIDILRDVIEAGVVVVAAMGNEFEEGNPIEYPAAMPEVCAVGATDRRDRRASFSNTGKHIDLVAPGVEILSTTPTYKYDDPHGRRKYDAMDGTSMATPCVAGAAALILARHPGSTPAQVVTRLTASADRVANAKKGSPSYGAGRLNVRKALAG
jgi:subtilisin family serine protease